MASGKNKKDSSDPGNPDGWRFIPRPADSGHDEPEEDCDLTDEELARLLEADLMELLIENPDIAEAGMEAISRWREAFIEDYGREPTQEDFIEYLDLIALDDDDWEEILDSVDDPDIRAFLQDDDDERD